MELPSSLRTGSARDSGSWRDDVLPDAARPAGRVQQRAGHPDGLRPSRARQLPHGLQLRLRRRRRPSQLSG